MKRWLLLVIVLNLLVLVGLAFVYPNLMIGPGPLTRSHAALATDCFACHAPWRGAAASRCTACHAVADIGRLTTTGMPLARKAGMLPFHQALARQDCMACHTEHAGVKLTQPAHPRFTHALLDSSIRERCASCHAPPTDVLHRQVGGNCRQCHATAQWQPASFDHARYFPLVGEHDAPCATCHAGNGFSRYTCYGCHAHTPAKIEAEHRKEGIRDTTDCVRCHRRGDAESERGDDD